GVGTSGRAVALACAQARIVVFAGGVGGGERGDRHDRSPPLYCIPTGDRSTPVRSRPWPNSERWGSLRAWAPTHVAPVTRPLRDCSDRCVLKSIAARDLLPVPRASRSLGRTQSTPRAPRPGVPAAPLPLVRGSRGRGGG